MSVFNIKGRCDGVDISLTELFEETKAEAIKRFPRKYNNVCFSTFSNMLHGRYNYGMGPEFVGIANELLNQKEAEKDAKAKNTRIGA
ncbi:MAG TPA: hypothetical protein VHP31_00895 [Caproicibacter sp.]|nr:hypothetical protein [Caproicibacter sp.]